MKNVLNVSSHKFTKEQVEELKNKYYDVVELTDDLKDKWGNINPENLIGTVNEICEFADCRNIHVAFVSGQLAANHLLVESLRKVNIDSIFAFTDRVSEEVTLDDGSVKKVSVFKHKGFFHYPDTEEREVKPLKSGLYMVIELDDDNAFLKLEWRKASTRECFIDKINGKYRLDMMCFGEWYPDVYFDTLDDLMHNLIDEWQLHDVMVNEVRELCERLVNHEEVPE